MDSLKKAISDLLTKPILLADGNLVYGRSSYAVTGHLRCSGFSLPGSSHNINALMEALGFKTSLTLSGAPIIHKPQ